MSDTPTHSSEPVDTASEAVHVESPKLAPGHHEAPRIEAPKVKAPHAGKITIMSPQRERTWEDFVDSAQQAEQHAEEAPRKRRLSAVAMVVALAAITGAVGGSLATAGLGQMFGRGHGVHATWFLAASHYGDWSVDPFDRGACGRRPQPRIQWCSARQAEQSPGALDRVSQTP